MIGAYLKFSPGKVFVIEADDEISGFIAAHSNGEEFYEKIKKEWLPSVRTDVFLLIDLSFFALACPFIIQQ